MNKLHEVSTPIKNLKRAIRVGALSLTAALAPGLAVNSAEAAPGHSPEHLAALEHKAETRIKNLQPLTLLNRTIAERLLSAPGEPPAYMYRQVPIVMQRRGKTEEKPSIAAIKRGDFAIATVFESRQGKPEVTTQVFNPNTMQILPAELDTRPLFEDAKLVSQGEGLPFTAINENNVLLESPKGIPKQVALAYLSYK